MEVHAHTHAHGKKNWKQYFWEFLMLFLAVFCGFLAENMREKIVERHREKQYIISMIEDLQTDTTNLSTVITGFNKREISLDSLIRGFTEGVKTYSDEWTKNFILTFSIGYPDFYYSDRTIQQLKNSGGMRLIINKKAASGIIKYDAEIKDLDFETTFLSGALERYREELLNVWSRNKMFADAAVSSFNNNMITVHKNYWITNNPLAFEHLFNRLSDYYEKIIHINKIFSSTKTKAIALIELLKKEYHLK